MCQGNKELNEMLDGLKASLKVFQKANDREAIYETQGHIRRIEAKLAEPCEDSACQECCAHDDRDHGICLDCGHEEDPGAAIDRAMDSLEER